MFDLETIKLKDALLEEFYDEYNWFVTLTFKNSERNIHRVNKWLHAMFTHLRQKLFGRRVARHINGSNDRMCIGSLELHADGAIHIHLLLKKPCVSHLLIAKNKTFGSNAAKHMENFWVYEKKLGCIREIKPLIKKSDKRKVMKYILKQTSTRNLNYFIAHWDFNSELLASDCNGNNQMNINRLSR